MLRHASAWSCWVLGFGSRLRSSECSLRTLKSTLHRRDPQASVATEQDMIGLHCVAVTPAMEQPDLEQPELPVE